MKIDEKKRIQEIQQGKKEIFAEIYESYLNEIYSFVARKIDQKPDVEDVVSTIFHKAFIHLEKVGNKQSPNIKARLYTIARNTIIDFYRAQKHKYHTKDDEIQDQHGLSPKEISQQNILVENIMKHLSQLGEEIHDLFIMRYRQKLSYAEITIINGKSEANNKKIFSRACQKLRQEFTGLSL